MRGIPTLSHEDGFDSYEHAEKAALEGTVADTTAAELPSPNNTAGFLSE